MAQRIVAEHAHVQSVTYNLPNKHYVPVDMKYIGVDNMTPYVPRLSNLYVTVLIAVCPAVRRQTCSYPCPRQGTSTYCPVLAPTSFCTNTRASPTAALSLLSSTFSPLVPPD